MGTFGAAGAASAAARQTSRRRIRAWHTEKTPGHRARGSFARCVSRQEGDASSLGSTDSRPESAGLSRLGVDGSTLVVGFAVPAGVLHPTRAAIIARASNRRLNMESPPLRQPTGCRRSVWELAWASGAPVFDASSVAATPVPPHSRRTLQSSRRCTGAPGTAPAARARETRVIGDGPRNGCAWERQPSMLPTRPTPHHHTGAASASPHGRRSAR